MATIFTRIINGDIPGTFVYRDESVVAFLSINPLADGHVLVVPRAEIDQWTDLPENLAQHVMSVAHRLGRAQRNAFHCGRVGVIIAGYEVPHCHVHVIPTNSMSQLSFDNAATSVERSVMEEHARRIRDNMVAVGLSPSE